MTDQESGRDVEHVVKGEPSGVGMPTFDTDQVVDWRCPCCKENGHDDRRSADYYPVCTNRDCPVKMFCVFRGESESKTKSGRKLEPEVGHKGPPIARKLFGLIGMGNDD